jgi:hypothetical protein
MEFAYAEVYPSNIILNDEKNPIDLQSLASDRLASCQNTEEFARLYISDLRVNGLELCIWEVWSFDMAATGN